MASASSGLASKLSSFSKNNFLSSSDLNTNQILSLFELAKQLKVGNRRIDLGNRVLGLIFKKASTRTRVSFQVAMARLGGQTVDLNPQVTQLGRGEPIKDTARVLSRYCDALAIRTFSQQEIEEYAEWSSIPVINALTDLEHPCQALADYLTIQEKFGELKGINLSYIGDGNNVANSLMICGALLGVNVNICSPNGFEADSNILEKARSLTEFGSKISICNDPFKAAKEAQVIYTDVWASMGQEKEHLKRKEIFEQYKVDQKLIDLADDSVVLLHCLPAHRGEEVTEEVLEGKNSSVFDQAENRLHVQQALLAVQLGGL
ncbi:ornithine carbamoyltransferase [Prochlorococcus marinus]|uniref:Ornithine carbamoyltransferase n=1 Tax=Prochlorococcus marinus XMU1408 TaxID=2213228 RepID=A0A318R2R1_PROMR|nr:ornithine carbamoyltransferase [Prochlorococcus marinus]MBW3042444.1 ornithine carbamoyltransferase [Prochlorococcus marinus str. XMU1408]PYE01180.1 ornithine carbamoyltransferase [Prochlorococcus marinus XMU1408]